MRFFENGIHSAKKLVKIMGEVTKDLEGEMKAEADRYMIEKLNTILYDTYNIYRDK